MFISSKFKLTVCCSLPAVAVLIAFYVFYCNALVMERVENRDEFLSPSGDFKAVLVTSDAGATTALRSEVYVMKADEKIDETVNNVFFAEGGYCPVISWESDNKLLIQHSKTNNTSKEESIDCEIDGTVHTINISYSENSIQ